MLLIPNLFKLGIMKKNEVLKTTLHSKSKVDVY